jgi:hypothetical protein
MMMVGGGGDGGKGAGRARLEKNVLPPKIDFFCFFLASLDTQSTQQIHLRLHANSIEAVVRECGMQKIVRRQRLDQRSVVFQNMIQHALFVIQLSVCAA